MEVDGDNTPYVLSAEKILRGLTDLRNQTLLCDVHLVAEGETFPVHRVVLAAASPYFQAMFTGAFKETGLNTITLQEVSAKGLKVVLDAIYTTDVNLSENNVDLVLPVANLMQMDDIVKACGTFMVDNMTVNNCLRFMNISEKYELESVVERASKFMFEVSCESFAAASEFDDLSQENLCKYLSDDMLKTPSGEIEVFRAAVKWIEKRPYLDQVNVPEILQHVRFPFISYDVLLDKVLHHTLIDRYEECKRMVKEALRFHCSVHTQPLQDGQQYRPRGEGHMVLIPSGSQVPGLAFKVQDCETKLHFLMPADNTTFMEDSMTTHSTVFAEHSLSVISHNNYLFLLGIDNSSFSHIFLRYNASTDKWIDLKPPPQAPTAGSAVAKSQDGIFIMGGVCVRESDTNFEPERFTDRTFRYSISDNSWKEVKRMKHALCCHAAASYQDVIYVAGGANDLNEVLDSTWAFDTRVNLWLRRASLFKSKCQFSLQAMDSFLYACGAYCDLEMYNIHEDQWTTLPGVVTSHGILMSSFVMKNKLYVVGGDEALDLVTCYDVRSKQLSQSKGLPFGCSGHKCALLIVPRR